MRARIGRRRFLAVGLALAGLGLATGCSVRLPSLTPAKVARIGILQFDPPGVNDWAEEDFKAGLRDLGWVEGQNVTFEARYGDSTYERLDALAAELIDLKPDLIYTDLATGVKILTTATRTIPIVFAGIGDATGAGSVQSLAHPGNNATGTISLVEGLAKKHLELLKTCVPTMSSVAALRHPAVAGQQWQDVQDAAAQFGLTFHAWNAPDAPGIEAAFASLKEQPVDGLVVISGATLYTERERIVRLALQHRLPAVYPFVQYAEAGGLLAYAANGSDQKRRAAFYADKILRGANPGDLPVERPTKIDVVVNLQTAQAMGLTIPQAVLSQATRVI